MCTVRVSPYSCDYGVCTVRVSPYSCDYGVCVLYVCPPIVVTMVCVYCTCVPLQLSGLGKIRPNTLVVGFKNNWTTCTDSEIQEYVALLQ